MCKTIFKGEKILCETYTVCVKSWWQMWRFFVPGVMGWARARGMEFEPAVSSQG